jgi:DNA processing protein
VNETTLFAWALEQMDGVGRVTAGRLLAHFPTYPDLLRYPREQVLLRIKGAPNGQALVGRLFDQHAMYAQLDQAREALENDQQRQVQALSYTDDHWPTGLAALSKANRPNLLYAYGHTAILRSPTVALFARSPFNPVAFEVAQDLVRHLIKHQVVSVAGASDGFDVVVHRICAASPTPYPSIMVSKAGLAKLERPMRPQASAAIKAGGVLLSSFPLQHGPFPHDDRERTLVQAALAGAVAFFEPQPQTPEWGAMEWAIAAHRPVFGVAAEGYPLPEQVHPIQMEIDFEWVVAAVTQNSL